LLTFLSHVTCPRFYVRFYGIFFHSFPQAIPPTGNNIIYLPEIIGRRSVPEDNGATNLSQLFNMKIPPQASLTNEAAAIPLGKKHRYLEGLSEDDFRDKVVRPLFLRMGFSDGRENCGPQEQGKDTILTRDSLIGTTEIHAIQTKKGNLNMARKQNNNVIEAITQLRTALETTVIMLPSKERRKPDKVYLIVSGRMNDASQSHIQDQLSDPRLEFLDNTFLIPRLDNFLPELWLNIDTAIIPYLTSLKSTVEDFSEKLSISDLIPNKKLLSSIDDGCFIDLKLNRIEIKPSRNAGAVKIEPALIERTALSILDEHETLTLIVGEGGSGKSTCLRKLCSEICKASTNKRGNFVIPILIRAVDLVKGRADLLSCLTSQARAVTGGGAVPFGTDTLEKGDVLILIDALDEVGKEEDRIFVANSIETFRKNYPKCHVILTSRNIAFLKNNDFLAKYNPFIVSSLSLKDASRIFTRVEKVVNAKSPNIPKAKELLRRLDQLHGLQLNPMLVTIMAAVNDISNADIPANLTELFKKYTELMLGRWDAEKGLDQQVESRIKDFILSKFAFKIHSEKRTSFTRSEFHHFVEEQLARLGHKQKVNALVEEIISRSNLFRVSGETLEFIHFIIQEFFAGRGIPSKEHISTILALEWWQRPIVFYFGDTPNSANSLSYLRELLEKQSTNTVISAVTCGLAGQACYLVETEEKVPLFTEVIAALIRGKEELISNISEGKVGPIMESVYYYLIGKDCVGFNQMNAKYSAVSAQLAAKFKSEDLIFDPLDAKSKEKHQLELVLCP
jgi:hypothetical protein